MRKAQFMRAAAMAVCLGVLGSGSVLAQGGEYSPSQAHQMWQTQQEQALTQPAMVSQEREVRAPVVVTTQDQSIYGSPKVLTLREAMQIGIATNPEYGVLSSNMRATDKELRQALGLFFPSVDFRGDAGIEYTDDPATRAGNDDDTETFGRYDASLTLTQMLFDGGEARYEERRQIARVLSATNRVREGAELIGLSIIEFYLDVMRQRKLLAIARDNVAEHEAIMDKIRLSADAGRSNQANVEQAQARLESARATEADTRRQLHIAEANYLREVGEKPEVLKMPVAPIDSLARTVEEEVDMALINSPTLTIFEADIDVAEEEFQGAQSAYYPRFDLQLNARNGENLSGINGRDTSASALVVMNWNLYRGGIDTARVEEFKYRKSQVKEQYAEASRDVENDVRQTWARMITAYDRTESFRSQANANVQVVDAYKAQFEANRRTLLDVLDAQNELFTSRSNAINSEFLAKFSVYRLLALRGDLLTTIQVDPPKRG